MRAHNLGHMPSTVATSSQREHQSAPGVIRFTYDDHPIAIPASGPLENSIAYIAGGHGPGANRALSVLKIKGQVWRYESSKSGGRAVSPFYLREQTSDMADHRRELGVLKTARAQRRTLHLVAAPTPGAKLSGVISSLHDSDRSE